MNKISTIVITVVLSMMLGGVIVAGATWALDDGDGGSTTSTANNARQEISDVGDVTDDSGDVVAPAVDYSELYEQVRPSVVRITTGDAQEDPFDGFSEGLGSGVVLDEEGHVLTNYHVVRGFDAVEVTFSDGTVVNGEVIGTDPGNDIAIVKADASADVLVPATLGDSSAAKIGSVVAALGNPFGLDGTFTTGILSGVDRTFTSSANGRPIRGLLQTDAAVNPGNSGGPLFNVRGEVIGINTAIENPSGGGFVGVAYAVPINTPKRFLTQLVGGDAIDHPRLGISGRTLSPSDAEQLGVPQGVAVIAVDPGSSADDAGLVDSADGEGDIIVAIDGEPMNTFEDLADYIDSKDVGDAVTLTVHRDGEDVELTTELKSWDSSA